MNGIQFSGTVLITPYRIEHSPAAAAAADRRAGSRAAAAGTPKSKVCRAASMPRFGSPVASGIVVSMP
jgi:hypothetical protein